MKKLIYSFVLIATFFSNISLAIDFETFKSNVTNDIDQQKDLPNLRSIWDSMLNNGFVDIGGNTQANKDHIVKIQAIIEYNLSKLPAEDSEAYIITPYPPTPLRLIGMANPFCADGKTLCPSFFRTSTLRQYISAGHPIELLYSNTGDNVPGIKFFNSFVANHPNITARLVNSVPDNLIGATYYFKLDDGKFIFSLKGNQSNTDTHNDWNIWFGNQDSERNLERTKEIFEYVKPFSNQ
jgi:hypothetical protein